MALSGRYVSLKTILDKVYRDNGYDTEISFGDAAEWAAEAMDYIAVPMQYVDKQVLITIEDYRGTLPCDFHNITNGAVIDKATNIPLKGNPGTAYQLDRMVSQEIKTAALEFTDDNIDPETGLFQIDKNGWPIVPDSIDYLRAVQSNHYIYYKPGYVDTETQHTYTLNNSFIFTSLEKGTLRMFYKAFPVDNEGFPLIPDDAKYIRAVANFITWRIDYKLYRMNKIAKDIVEASEQQWYWAVGSAKGKAHIMTLDQHESFKNMMTKLIPTYSNHASSFRYAGEQETITFRNSRT